MSEQTVSPTQPKTAGSKTISGQKKQKSKALKILTIVEIAVIAVLSALNIWGVAELAHFDPYYKLYYFYAISGVIFIVLLIVAYYRKWLGFQLISIILFMLWSTYCAATVYSCRLLTHVKKMEEPYMNAEMYVVFNGKLYTFEGKTIVYGLPAEWEDLQSRAIIKARDDSKIPTEELTSKGIPEGSMIFYQEDYKYILVEIVTGSLFEFIDPNDPPTEPISTNTTTIGLGA